MYFVQFCSSRYLKCEMYNPQYTARFAVIMEAYLKACGESMLVRYSVDHLSNVIMQYLELVYQFLSSCCSGCTLCARYEATPVLVMCPLHLKK